MKDKCLWKAKKSSLGPNSLFLSFSLPLPLILSLITFLSTPHLRLSSDLSLVPLVCMLPYVNFSFSLHWKDLNLRRVV